MTDTLRNDVHTLSMAAVPRRARHRIARRGAVALTGLVAGLVLSGVASVAQASPAKRGVAQEQAPFSYIPDDVQQKMLAQRPLSKATHWVRSVIEGGPSAGFAGMALQGNALVVWWKGSIPERVMKAIASARATAAVEVRQAPHSLADLKAASAVIVESMKANPNGPFHGVATRVDGSGLVVESSAVAKGTAARGLPAVGVPVRVVHKERRTAASRLADTAPYWGGARITNMDNGGQCSSGFGVTAGGTNYLLTAGHCGRPGGGWWNGNRSRTIGTANRENVGHDLLLIPTNAGGRIYDGGVGAGEFSKGVAGWQWVVPGESLCLSPSVTGVICGATVTNNFTQTDCGHDPYGNYECYSDLVVANNGNRACQGGDSGGPVFSLAPNSRVYAKGTITACGSRDFSFQDFGTATRDFGITTIVG